MLKRCVTQKSSSPLLTPPSGGFGQNDDDDDDDGAPPMTRTFLGRLGRCWVGGVGAGVGALAAGVVLHLGFAPFSAMAGAGEKPPPVRDMPGGCTVDALDLFAEVRSKFSLEVGTGALPEAVLDLGGCDYSGADMTGKVLSGVIASNANFENAKVVRTEMSRAQAVDANFKNADLSDTNAYEVNFAGSDMTNVVFENAILTNARFGKDANGQWTKLDGANFEGALLSSSDAQRACENPTVDDFGRAILGCR